MTDSIARNSQLNVLEQIRDGITGQSGEGLQVHYGANEVVIGAINKSALNLNLLTDDNNWFDASEYQSGSIQIIGSAGISAGAIIFEQTNDTALAPSGVALQAQETSSVTTNPIVAATTIAASTARMFAVNINARFIRVRISTAFTGGTVSLVACLSERPASYSVVNVQQATAANLNATASLAAGTNLAGDVGMQVRANATGAATVHHIVSAATTNALNVKNAAGRVFGWSLANTTAAWKYVKLHNVTTAPTAGTGVVLTIAIPPNSKSEITFPIGLAFTTGIGRTVVNLPADSDATAVAVNDVVGDIYFA